MLYFFKQLAKYPKVEKAIFIYITNDFEYEFQIKKYGNMDINRCGDYFDYRTLSGWIDAFFREHYIFFEIFAAPNPREFWFEINRRYRMAHYRNYQQAHIAAWLKAAEILEGEI